MRINDLIGRNSSDVIRDLMAWQTEVEQMVLTRSPHLAAQVAKSGSVPIHMLPFREQVAQMGRYRSIIGLDQALLGMAGQGTRQQQVQNIWSQLREVRPMGERAPYGKFATSYNPGDNILEAIYSGINLNYRDSPSQITAGVMDKRNFTTASHFGVGRTSIPKVSQERFNMPTSMGGNKKFMTFDIETAGLMQNQIREVAYSVGRTDAAGTMFASTQADPILFRPRLFSRGSIGMPDAAGRVRSNTLEEYLGGKYGMSVTNAPTQNMGLDYASRMRPFLEQMRDSDHVIGHNISSFDIPQIFGSLVGTKAYTDPTQSIIPGFKSLVDTVYNSLPAKTIDTLTLVRQASNLSGLGVDSDILAKGGGSIYSIENLLLQTNLADKIGIDNLKAAMGTKGLHFGDIDTLVTTALFQHLDELTPQTLQDSVLRKSILDSSAITPTTNIVGQENISDNVLRYMIDVQSGIHAPAGSTLEQLMADPAQHDAAFNLIRGGNSGASFKLNPLEHQAMETRRLGLGLPTNGTRAVKSDDLIFGNNEFDKFAYDQFNPNRNHARGLLDQRRVSDSDMMSFQDRLAKRGTPWAGASYEERSFGTALSHLTSTVNPASAYRDVGELNSDTLSARFESFDARNVAYTTASGRPSLPESLMREHGLFNETDPAMLRMSVINPSALSAQPRVNLIYDFADQEQVEGFASYIEQLGTNPNTLEVARHLGIENADEFGEAADEVLGPVSRFRAAVREGGLVGAIRDGGLESGVSIGQLQPQHASGVIEALQNFHGFTDLRDESMQAMALPYMRSGGGFVETSGVFLGRHGLGESKAMIGREVGHARQVADAYMTMGKDSFAMGAAKMAARAGDNDTSIAAIRKGYEAYQKIRPHLGIVAGTVALGALAAHFYGNHKENQQYAATMNQMPYETGGSGYAVADVLQMQKDSGIDRSYQRYDPLKTAFVVDNLNNSKVNHTNMSWDRNNSLYGGVI